MSTPPGPDGKPAASPAPADPPRRGTVGVYDRPASADRPSRLPKIITAIVVVLMLVVTWLFWPKSAAAAPHETAPAAAARHEAAPAAAAAALAASTADAEGDTPRSEPARAASIDPPGPAAGKGDLAGEREPAASS